MASAQISEIIRPAYIWTGSEWVQIGDGGSGGGSGSTFLSIETSPATQTIVADSTTDTLTFIAGENISITAASASDSITINSTGNYSSVDSISYPDYIVFDTTPENTSASVGTLAWDSGESGLSAQLNSNINVTLGQEIYSVVYNGEATQLNKGEVVMISGAQGQKPRVIRAYNTSDAGSARTFGIVAENIESGAEGIVITQGIVKNINTNGFNEGDPLYLSATPGQLTTTKPQAPNHYVWVGVVVKKNSSSGRIYVKPQNGYELDEIHDVRITSIQNDDLIVYNSASSIWVNSPKQNIINTASAAAYASASAYTNTSLIPYLTQSSASSTYIPLSASASFGGGGAISVSSTAPASASEGDGWFDNTDGKFYVYDGTFWVESAPTDAAYAAYNRWTKVLSGSASIITGLDDNGVTLDYTPGQESLYINGIFIDRDSYTATSGSSIILDEISFSGDVIEIVWLDNIAIADIANIYLRTEQDNLFLTQVSASNTYLTQNSASNTYTTLTQFNNIDLTSTINTASAAAYASASAYTNSASSSLVTYTNTQVSEGINTASAAAVNYLIDSAPGTLDTLNELSAALNDDPNFYSTIQSVYLTQSNASATYLTQSSASTTYLSQSSASGLYLTTSNASSSYASIVSPSFSGSANFASASVVGILDVAEVREVVVNNSFSTNVLTANYNDGAIHYIATAPTANFTISLTNVPTTTPKSITMAFLVTQGATGYIPTTFNINGSSQTIRWVGGSAPSPTSSVGKIDIFNFTIILSTSTIVIASANLNI
jgi:hypothetical protein